MTRALVGLSALALLSSVTAGAQANAATGLFVFSRASGPPGTAVVISTASGGQFSGRDRVHLYLVPKAISKVVRTTSDERITSVGMLRTDQRGRGVLRVKLPDIAPGEYVVGRWCPTCKKRSYRAFTVLLPTRSTPRLVRARMSLRIEDVRRCNAAYSESLLKEFFAGFNSSHQLTRFLAPEDRWIWWRDPDNMQVPVPYAELASYLRALRETGVVFELESFSFTGYRSSPRLGEFGFRLDRGDRPAGNAKGAIDCTTGLLALVTIDRW